jgi:hypothetical protein
MTHALYLPPASQGAAAATASRCALEFVEGTAAELRRQLGVTVKVYALRPKDATDARVLAAFRGRGVSSLPALLAGGRAHVGCHAIEEYYKRLLPPAAASPPAASPPRSRAGAWRPPPARAAGFGDGARDGARDERDDPEEIANSDAVEDLDSYMLSEIGIGGHA